MTARSFCNFKSNFVYYFALCVCLFIFYWCRPILTNVNMFYSVHIYPVHMYNFSGPKAHGFLHHNKIFDVMNNYGNCHIIDCYMINVILRRKNKAAVNHKTGRFDINSAVIMSSVCKAVQNCKEFMLSKRPVLRFTAALFFLLKLFLSHIYCIPINVIVLTTGT